MRNRLNIKALILTVLLFFCGTAQATSIIQIAVDLNSVVFLLDDTGHVWGFEDFLNFQDPIKLPNLEHITKIAPYIAVDDKGQVFTWDINNKKTRDTDGEISQVGYTTPSRVEGLSNVTLIASSFQQFVAVVNNQDIFEWKVPSTEIQLGLAMGKFGPIRNVISKKGVKEISVAPFSQYGGVVALFDDGAIIGSETLGFHQLSKADESTRSIMGSVSGANNIALSNMHSIIIFKDGKLFKLDGCHKSRKEGNEQVDFININDEGGNLTNLTQIAFAQNAYMQPDIFLKRDGTVWVSYLTSNTGKIKNACGQLLPPVNYYHKTRQLIAGKYAAVQVATGSEKYFMLDANHELWVSEHIYNDGPMYKINIPHNN